MSERENIAASMVEEHGDYLMSVALMKVQDRELAKDLVQDTFVSALMALDKFEERSSLRTWLTSILQRKIIDYWRKAETKYADPISSFFSGHEHREHWVERQHSTVNLENIESRMIREENYNLLRECLDKLPSKWKAVLLAKYFQEEKSEDICKEMNLSSSNLWVIIHRAKLLLRDCLQQNN